MALIHRSKNTSSSSKEECKTGPALRKHTRATQTSNVINHYPRTCETNMHLESRKEIHHKKLYLFKVERNQVVNRCNVSELIKVTIFQYKQNYKTKKTTFAVSSITANNTDRLVRSGVAKWLQQRIKFGYKPRWDNHYTDLQKAIWPPYASINQLENWIKSRTGLKPRCADKLGLPG